MYLPKVKVLFCCVLVGVFVCPVAMSYTVKCLSLLMWKNTNNTGICVYSWSPPMWRHDNLSCGEWCYFASKADPNCRDPDAAAGYPACPAKYTTILIKLNKTYSFTNYK